MNEPSTPTPEQRLLDTIFGDNTDEQDLLANLNDQLDALQLQINAAKRIVHLLQLDAIGRRYDDAA